MRSPASRNIALVDFRWHGHHPRFFSFFYDELRQVDGCNVIPFHPRTSDEPDFPVEQEIEDEVLTHRWIRKWPALANVYRFSRCAQRLQRFERKHGVAFDLVFFTTLYHGAALSRSTVDRLFPYHWSALLLDSDCCRRSWISRLVRAKAFDLLAAFRAEGCCSVLTLDRGIVDSLRRQLPDKRVEFLPEPVRADPPNESFSTAQEIRRRAAGRKVVGCFGQFDKRKGGLDFLETARLSQAEPWLFVWVGELIENSFSTTERRLIEACRREQTANTFLAFEKIRQPADFNALICAADVLFLCYADHAGSSNVVHTAAVFEKPILVSKDFCMADDTHRYLLGLTVARGDVAKYVAALHALLEGKGGRAPDYARYRRDHAIERQRETILKMLEAT